LLIVDKFMNVNLFKEGGHGLENQLSLTSNSSQSNQLNQTDKSKMQFNDNLKDKIDFKLIVPGVTSLNNNTTNATFHFEKNDKI